MGEPKIGEKERALREMREARFQRDRQPDVKKLREKVAAIPARKPPKPKGRKP